MQVSFAPTLDLCSLPLETTLSTVSASSSKVVRAHIDIAVMNSVHKLVYQRNKMFFILS